MEAPWNRWLEAATLANRLTETQQRLLVAEGECAVLKYERDAAQEAAAKWELRAYELMPEGVATRVEFYKGLYVKWRAEAERLRAAGAPFDGEQHGDW